MGSPPIPATDRMQATAAELVPFFKCFVTWLAPDTTFEVRALDVLEYGTRRCTQFGYFRIDGHKPFFAAIKSLVAMSPSDQPAGVYVAINPVNPALYSRAAGRLKVATKKDSTACDADIAARRWMYIDVDPVRPAGISATEAEKAEARTVIDGVRADLDARGWPLRMLIDSGNGYHLWYAIDLPADDDGLVQKCLQALAARHSTSKAKVDTSIYNAARIAKIPGTWARKGDDTPERPHRLARVLEVCE